MAEDKITKLQTECFGGKFDCGIAKYVESCVDFYTIDNISTGRKVWILFKSLWFPVWERLYPGIAKLPPKIHPGAVKARAVVRHMHSEVDPRDSLIDVDKQLKNQKKIS